MGKISGILGPGEFEVVGDLVVSFQDSLRIMAPSDLRFQYGTSMTVYGSLHAEGTPSDSIRFMPYEDAPWSGLRVFQEHSGCCFLSHCVIRGASQGGVFCVGADVRIETSDIRENAGTLGGGIRSYDSILDVRYSSIRGNVSSHTTGAAGVYLSSSSGSFFDTRITGNTAGTLGAGGGMRGVDSDVIVESCIISANTADTFGGGVAFLSCSAVRLLSTFLSGNGALNGGAIYLGGSPNVIVDGAWIRSNEALRGGGMFVTDSRVAISCAQLLGNSAVGGAGSPGMGGALFLDSNTDLVAQRCSFILNLTEAGHSSISRGDGIHIDAASSGGDTVSITESIFAYHSESAVHIESCPEHLVLEYSDFWMNSGGASTGNHDLTEFGQCSEMNGNEDPCDPYSNIFMDPFFLNPEDLDIRLMADSPCIDAGDPTACWDPDNTPPDMGACWHDQGLQQLISLTASANQESLSLSWDYAGGLSVDAFSLYGWQNCHFPGPCQYGPEYMLAIISPNSSDWSTVLGIGDPLSNWTYQIIATDASEAAIAVSNRVADFDFSSTAVANSPADSPLRSPPRADGPWRPGGSGKRR